MKRKLLSFLTLLMGVVGLYAAQPEAGAYMLHNVTQDKYLLRNSSWYTKACLDEYGLAVIVAPVENQDGYFTIEMFEKAKDKNNANYVFQDGDNASFTDLGSQDKSRSYWTLETGDNGAFYLVNKYQGKYATLDADGYHLYLTDQKTAADQWRFENGTTHAASMASKKAKMLKALGIESLDGLTAEDVTGVAPTAYKEMYQPSPYTGTEAGRHVVSLSDLNFSFTAPKTGLYKVVVPSMYRIANLNNFTQLVNAGVDQSAVVARIGDYMVAVPGISAGATDNAIYGNTTLAVNGVDKYVPNSMDAFKAWAEAGYYATELYTTARAGETIDVKFEVIAAGMRTQGNWAIAYGPGTKVTYYNTLSADKAAAIEAAITAAKEKLGFEKGQYAPYNNAAALAAISDLDAAGTDAQATAALAALDAVNWVENDKRVNAIYNGNFALSQNDGAMEGWRMTNSEITDLGGAYHSRAFVLTSGMTNYDQLAAFNQGDGVRSCAYMRFDGTNSDKGSLYHYGQGTTIPQCIMPLKAGVEYTLDLDFGGWGNSGTNARFYITDAAGQAVGTATMTPTDDNKINEVGKTALHVNFTFTPTVDGNCVLHVQNPGASSNLAIAVSNIVIRAPKLDQTITWGTLPEELELGQSFELSATATSGKDVTFEVSGTATTTREGNKITATSKGTIIVTAKVEGDDLEYNEATSEKQIIVGVKRQTVTFNLGMTETFRVGDTYTIPAGAATATSGLTDFTYSVAEGDAVTLEGNVLTAVKAGVARLVAAQAGNEDWAAGTDTVDVTVNKALQTITWNQNFSGLAYGETVELNATASSGLAVEYAVKSGDATIADGKVTFNATGAFELVAKQSGNADYEAADSIVKSVNVAKAGQSIVWDQLFLDAKVGKSYVLKATATSGLPVAYEITYGAALGELAGDTLKLTGKGTLKVTATQPGDDNYGAAEPVLKDFFIGNADDFVFELADGAYMLYADGEGFLTRGAYWGTQAKVDPDYGIPFNVTKVEGDTYTIVSVDAKGYLFDTGDNNAYVDGNDTQNIKWVVEPKSATTFNLKNEENGNYLAVFTDEATGVKHLKPVQDETPALWTAYNGEQYTAYLQAKRDEQIAPFAEALELEADDEATLKAGVKLTDVTEQITFPSRGESYQPTSGEGRFVNEVEMCNVEFALPTAGVYLIEFPAMMRSSNNATQPEFYNAGLDYTSATLSTGEFTAVIAGTTTGVTPEMIEYDTYESDGNKPVELAIDGDAKWVPNSQDSFQAWAEAGYYKNTLYVTAAADGATVSVKAVSPLGKCWSGQWFCHNAPLTKVYLMEKDVTGITGIDADSADARYFTIQGFEVAKPQPGQVYIVVKGNKASKVRF